MNEKIKEIIQDTLKEYTIDKIILFGSRARGDNNADSDYDLYIITKESIARNRRIELMDLILEKLAVNKICADVVLRSNKEVEIYKDQIGTITKEVLEGGIII